MSKQGDIVQAHCNKCLQETKHVVLWSRLQEHTETSDDGNFIFAEETMFEMLECCGCEDIIFRSNYTSSYLPHETVNYYPPAISRRKPEWLGGITSVPWKLTSLINEVYAAIFSESHCLAMMGVRALLDMVIVGTAGDKGVFSQKLDALIDEGFVSKNNRIVLEATLEAGHAAAHRGHSPSVKEVNNALDIIENLIQAVYVLGDTADTLQQATPPRLPRKKKTVASKTRQKTVKAKRKTRS